MIYLGGDSSISITAEVVNNGEEAHQAKLIINHPRTVVFEGALTLEVRSKKTLPLTNFMEQKILLNKFQLSRNEQDSHKLYMCLIQQIEHSSQISKYSLSRAIRLIRLVFISSFLGNNG